MSTSFGRLASSDLRGFDQRGRELILKAMEYGAVGRVSAKGHVILRSKGGATMSVTRNLASSNRARQNTEAAFSRIFGEYLVQETKVESSNGNGVEHPLVPADPVVMKPCPLESCEAEFVTEGARYSHVHRDHFPCREPGCDRVFASKQGEQGHYNLAHHRKELMCGPAKCEVKGCGWTGTKAGLGGHTARMHEPGAQKRAVAAKKASKAPKESSKTSETVASVVRAEAEHYEGVHAQEVLDAVRGLVAPELTAKLAAAEARVAELETKLALMKEVWDA